MRTKLNIHGVIQPEEKHPGWNAFHYFNFHYRQNQAKFSPTEPVKMDQIREAWVKMDDLDRKPFLELQKAHMQKYRKGGGFSKKKGDGKHKRRPSACSVMKKRLSLLEYGPENGENWNTWASGIQKQMIKWFQGQHPEFKTLKEATHEWRCHWLALEPAEQGDELRAFFGK
jgi:hypothetical protein